MSLSVFFFAAIKLIGLWIFPVAVAVFILVCLRITEDGGFKS